MVKLLTNEEIGERIRDRRISLGMTQGELGERLGVGAAAVNKWETGLVKNIKRDLLKKLVLELKIHPAILIGLDMETRGFVVSAVDYNEQEMNEIESFLNFIKSKRGD